MDFSLTEGQQMLKKSARGFLTGNCPKTYLKQMEADVKGYSSALWQQMAKLGWQGLMMPEKSGGSGMEFIDLAVLLEEMGRVCLPGPFFSTAILGAVTILEHGNEKQKAALLPGIAAGKMIVTMALTEADGLYAADSMNVIAAADGGDYIINGTKLFVPGALAADYILCAARTGKSPENITIFLVPAKEKGVKCTSLQTISGDKLCEVVFTNVKVPKTSLVGGLNKGWPIIEKVIERAAVAKCCDTVGILQKVLEMTVDYAKERKQFDKPIGSFQVIQQYLAEMATNVDGARFVTYQTAWKISRGLPSSYETAVAKSFCAEAYEWNIAKAHQIFGAIGMTLDHDLHFYTTRGKANQLSYGKADYWQEPLAKAMGL